MYYIMMNITKWGGSLDSTTGLKSIENIKFRNLNQVVIILGGLLVIFQVATK